VIRVVVVAFALMIGACTRIEPDAIPNVKLGMAPGDVRDRFEPGGPGTWQTSLGKVADDTAIEWKATDGSAKIREARFEFHLGMLVAVRATSNEPPPPGEKISTTPASVTVRRAAPSAGGVTETAILARDCPTHKDEAASLVARMK
jgi:hypothetical protein